jgi:hypothetical protein
MRYALRPDADPSKVSTGVFNALLISILHSPSDVTSLTFLVSSSYLCFVWASLLFHYLFVLSVLDSPEPR